jgi:hypothetical protein
MRKLIAVIFAICLAIPLLFVSQIAISTATWALDEQFYVDSLDNESVYRAVFSADVMDGILRSRLSLPADTDTTALQNVIRSVVSEDYLKMQTTTLVSDFFDYWHGKTDQFEPTVDLQPIKAALTAEKQDEFLNALVKTLPVCRNGQTPGFGGESQSACKPQGISDEALIENYYKPAMPEILKQVPDQIALGNSWQTWLDQEPWGRFLAGRAAPASLMLLVIFLAFVAVCFWYITALIADDSWRVRLQWLGWTLIIPSLVVLLLGLLTQGITSPFWLESGMQSTSIQIFSGPAGTQAVVDALNASVLPRVSISFLMVGGICSGAALGLIVWGLTTPKKTNG